MNSLFGLCIRTAACFGIWPVISQLAGVNNAWYPFIVCLGATLTTATQLGGAPFPAYGAAAILLISGVVNGNGFISFGKVTGSGENLSRVLPLIFVMMTAFTVIAALLVLREPMTARKAAGVALAMTAIWFLN